MDRDSDSEKQGNSEKDLNFEARRQQGIKRKKQLEEKAKESGVSISQLKKQIRKEKWEAEKLVKRKQKRQQQKLKKKQKKALKSAEVEQNIGVKKITEDMQKVEQKHTRKRKEEYEQKMIDGLKVVIDLQFYDLMTEKEANSLIKQLSYCHSANRKAERPFNYILTSTTENFEQQIESKYNGKKWGIKFVRQPLHQAFNIENIVYLTGDSTDDIEEFEDDKIYIIGGIVDHNRLKKITYNYAVQHKIPTKRLPLKDIKLKTNVHLAVNHVWEWMLRKHNGQGWDQALQSVLPQRKIVKIEDTIKQGEKLVSKEN